MHNPLFSPKDINQINFFENNKNNLLNFQSKTLLDIKTINGQFFVITNHFFTEFGHIIDYFRSKIGLEGMIW